MSTAYDNFIARVTAPSAGLAWAYRQLLDGLTSDGLFNSDGTSNYFDVLYIFATQNSTTALLNLVSSSFTGTAQGSPAFVANQGFTGADNSTTIYIDTGFNATTATSPNFTQDSAHISVWTNTDLKAINGGDTIGVFNAAVDRGTQLNPWYSDDKSYYRINEGPAFSGGTVNTSTLNSHFLVNRSSASAQQGYKNAVDQGVVAVTSGSLVNLNFYVLATNRGGTPGVASGAQISSASIGASLTPAQVTSFYNRLAAFKALADAGFPLVTDQRRRVIFHSPRRGPLTGKAYIELQPPLPPTPQQPDPYEQRAARPWRRPNRGPFSRRGYIEVPPTPTSATTQQIANITLLDTVTLVNQINIIKSISLLDTITTIKQVKKTITTTLLDTITKFTIKAFNKLIPTITLLDTVTVIKQVGKTISTTLLDTITSVKQIRKFISTSLLDTITSVKQVGKIIILGLVIGFGPTIRSIGQITTVNLLDTVTLTQLKVKLFAVPTIVINDAVTLIKQTAHIINIGLIDTITKIAQVGKIIKNTLLDTVTLTQLKVKLFAVPTIVINDTVTMVRQTGKIINISLLNTISLIKLIGKIINVSLVDTITTIKQIRKIIQNTLLDTITLIKQTGKIINVSLLDTITTIKQVAHKITIAILDTVTLTQLKVKLFAVPTIVINDAVTLIKQTGKIVFPTLLDTVTLTKQTGHIINVGLIDTITTIKSISHNIAVTLLDTITLIKIKAFNKLIPTIIINGAITLIKQVGKTITPT
ncbi:MAG TPA: hypothetical protein VEP90_23710, partial [Methylomirabilota bacterium]|nr:hypothetical protein [Methylomirabilota bacterium]